MSCHKHQTKDDKCVVVVKGPRGPIGETAPPFVNNLSAYKTTNQTATGINVVTPIAFTNSLLTPNWTISGNNFVTSETGRYSFDYTASFILVGSGSGYAYTGLLLNNSTVPSSIVHTYTQSFTETTLTTVSGSIHLDVTAGNAIGMFFLVTFSIISLGGNTIVGVITPVRAQLNIVRIA